MSKGNDGAIGVKERLREEFTRHLEIRACLHIGFGAIQRCKAAPLAEQGLRYAPLGFALAKALILGKFALVRESRRVGSRVRAPTLLHRIAARTVFVFLLLLAIIEEVLVGTFAGKLVAQVFPEYLQQRSLAAVVATSLLGLLVLVPLIVVENVDKAVQPDGLLALPGGNGALPGAR